MAGEFVGRASQLEEMRKSLGLPHPTTRRRILVLQGLGGIGKTQIAIEHAIRSQRSYTAIFWANGKTETMLRLSIAALAEQVPLPDVLDSKGRLKKGDSGLQEAINAVMSWFDEPNNTRWLLIIDNVDSQLASVVGKQEGNEESYDVRQYFPSNTRGSIIITTRLSRLRRLGIGLEINEMDPDEGLQVLCQASGRPIHEEGIVSKIDSKYAFLTLMQNPKLSSGNYMGYHLLYAAPERICMRLVFHLENTSISTTSNPASF